MCKSKKKIMRLYQLPRYGELPDQDDRVGGKSGWPGQNHGNFWDSLEFSSNRLVPG
jgi:hypothetical protein